MTIFSPELITLNMAAQDKQQVLALMAKTMDAAGRLQPNGYDNYLITLKNRECDFSTAVGYSFAIPHGKTNAVKMPSVAFARLTTPVLWDEEDEDWVSNVFMIAVPMASASDEHMKILMKLSTAILEDDFREQLEQAVTEEDIFFIIQSITI
ncbi:TPA: PTS sugar transporter subunit IIA [Yersinia enterocolitica]